MGTSRRQFLAAGAALGAGVIGLVATGGSAGADSPVRSSRRTWANAETLAEISDHLGRSGFRPVAPAPLVTGISYNGGLNYDEGVVLGQLQYVLQSSARIEDVANANVPGTLPLFTIAGISFAGDPVGRFGLVMAYLTQVVGLDPRAFRITTTDHASSFFPLLATYGITAGQIRLRPWATAVAAGDGSGYFAPAGYPKHVAIPTFSIEHVQSDGTEIELGEFGFSLTGTPTITSCGIGVERLTMARNNRLQSWSNSLPAFRAAVESSAGRQHVPLPVGYYDIVGSRRD